MYMQEIEKIGRERMRRNRLKLIMLDTVKAAGVLSVALMAPNVIGAMDKLGMIPSPRQRDVVKRSVTALVRKRLLRWDDGKLRLTQKGEAELLRLEMRNFQQRCPRGWDQRWRILIFDIPEYRRGLRNRIRETLRAVGFVRLQNSVWAYPYDCEDLIVLLKADFKIGREMLYMVVDSLEGDASLRKAFGLDPEL
jgi:CRISPR/Cas system-associated endoribonuclease Cas2